MPRISIVVPLYNAKRYIGACLESILSQTYVDLEVIVVDDGSADSSASVVERYQSGDGRVRLVSQRRAGAGAARNRGIEASGGSVIMSVDADDMLEPNACEIVAARFDQYTPELLCFGFSCEPHSATPPALVGELRPRARVYEGFDPAVLYEDHARPFAWRLAFSREFVRREQVRYDPSLSLGDDQYLCFYVYPRSRRTVLIPDQLYRYRMHGASMMHSASDASSDLADKIDKHRSAVIAILNDWQAQGWQGVRPSDLLGWVLDLLALDVSRLPPASQGPVLLPLLRRMDDYFVGGVDAIADRATRPLVRSVRRAAAEGGPAFSRGELALFYLRRRGLANCVRRVVRSRF